MTAANKVRFGVIGTGGMGSGHCSMIPGIPETELTAICDINEDVRTAIAKKHGVPAFAHHSKLLDSGLVDAVTIATPHYFHPPIAIEAFSKGIHVMSEKPLAVTVSAADSMIEAAKKSGLKFGIMYQMRAEAQNQAAKRIVESGALGEIYRTSLVMAWYRSQAYYNSGGWRATWAGEGGGVLINQAPHYLDLFTWLGGLPKTISGTTRTRLHDIEVEDEAFATLEYENGAHGYLYASTTEVPNNNMLEISGDKGKLVLDNGTLRLFALDGAIREFTHSTDSMWGSPKSTDVSATVEMPAEAEGAITGHGAITQNFARAILFNEPLLASGYDGLNAVELINGIILSSKRGETVSVPVDREAYNNLIIELQKSSQHKGAVVEQRVTDPSFA